MRNKLIGIIAAVVVVVAAGAGLGAVLIGSVSNTPTQASQEAAASSTVASFGKLLQQVSIMAPNASSTIASTYAPYVDPALLKQWESDPKNAPGRVVSSPWPDHISIDPRDGFVLAKNVCDIAFARGNDFTVLDQ